MHHDAIRFTNDETDTPMISQSNRTYLRLLACALSLVIPSLFGQDAATRARAQGSLEGETKRGSPRPPGSTAPHKKPPTESPAPRPPRIVELSVVTNVPACRIFLDERASGETDADGQLTLPLRPGTHTIRAEQQGYFIAEQVVNAPRASAVVFNLTPRLFELKVKTTLPAASVSLDGRVAGRTGADGQLTLPRLSSGAHKLSVALNGYVTNEQSFKLSNNATIFVALLPDPAVAVEREIERALAADDLARAFDAYRRHASVNLPALAGVRDAMLQRLQLRSQNALQHTEPDGLFIAADEAGLLQRLFRDAAAWRADDARLTGLADYWAAKNFEARFEQTTLSSEHMSLALSERDSLARVGVATMRQYDLVLYDMGWCYFRRGDATSAERLFIQTRAQNPSWSLPRYALARVMLDRAAHEADAGPKRNYLNSVSQELGELISANPIFAQALAARALALVQLGEIKEALAYAQNAVLLKPSSAYAHYVFSFILFQRGKTRDARREIDAALAARPFELDDTSRRIAQLMRDQIRN
jgi:tetratricopeptide (TPR) repeat protein